MTSRRSVSLLLLSGALSGRRVLAAASSGAPSQAPPSYVAWVGDVLTQMQKINSGMTRNDLLKVFTIEGGLSTGLQRTFVSRDCPYFKVDVEFNAVGRPNRDQDGYVTLFEDPRDIIIKISKPYLEFAN
jgi:hypothetical protein